MIDIVACSPLGTYVALECKDPEKGLDNKAKKTRFEDQLRILNEYGGIKAHVGVVKTQVDLLTLMGLWGYAVNTDERGQ